jgi:hypothetical protein
VPFYGSAHGVVPTEAALRWIEALLVLDWKRSDGAAAAAANVARRSGDLARDLPQPAQDRVIRALQAAHAPAGLIKRVHEVATLDEVGQNSVFGESLPPGLKLLR